MLTYNNIRFSVIFASFFLSLVSCGGMPDKGNSNQSSSMMQKSMSMKMEFFVLFKKDTSYLDISELNGTLPEHSHKVIKSKKVFIYSFSSHKNYMEAKDILANAAIVQRVANAKK